MEEHKFSFEELSMSHDDTHDPQVIALAQHLGCDPEDIEDKYGYYEAEGGEYRVMNDDDADMAWDESLEEYIDDCLEMPDWIRPFFDRDKWKEEAKHDGRGHCLSGYDGNEDEDEEEVNGERYYIFRVN